MNNITLTTVIVITGIASIYTFYNPKQNFGMVQSGKSLIAEKTANEHWEPPESLTFNSLLKSEVKLSDSQLKRVKAVSENLHPQINQLAELERSQLGPSELLMKILPLLDIDDPIVRLAVVEFVKEINHPEVRTLLVDCLNDNQPSIRIAAIEALAYQNDDAIAVVLEPFLYDKNREVRLVAVEVLGELENEDSIYALSSLLIDTDQGVKLKAINAMGEIGGEAAESYISQLIYDPNQLIRESALAVLDD